MVGEKYVVPIGMSWFSRIMSPSSGIAVAAPVGVCDSGEGGFETS